MKLHKWRCGTCGSLWFEPAESGNSDHSIDHGCPQGCDDTGKVVDTVEATDNKGQWICWVVSKADIDTTAKRVASERNLLTQDNYDKIARTFIKGFEWANEQWADILEDAVKEVMR